MEARGLRYFLVVAEELHFGRAAQRLSVAQPVLSRAIRRAEEELGVELFTRDSHEVRLTDAGELLLDPAREAVGTFAEAIAAAREAGGRDIVATLDVGTTPLVRHRLAPSIFERFAIDYPKVTVSRREEFGGLLVEELLARRLDVVLALCPTRHEGLTYEPFREPELAVLVADSHPLAASRSVSLADLSAERFQLPSNMAAPALRERFAECCTEAGFAPRYFPTPIDHDEVLAGVREGAVTLASRFYLETPPAGIAVIPLEPSLPMPFELVWRREPSSPALRRFVRVARGVAQLGYDALGQVFGVQPSPEPPRLEL